MSHQVNNLSTSLLSPVVCRGVDCAWYVHIPQCYLKEVNIYTILMWMCFNMLMLNGRIRNHFKSVHGLQNNLVMNSIGKPFSIPQIIKIM